jgi:crotonobetainyl-CoA:carnitine CoA-transferase CaiB-like acyl-CoA transferase
MIPAFAQQAPSGPLAGVRVIDLAVNVLGPLTGQLLGDMGADVVKIEPPDGDPMRHSGKSNNRGMAALFMNTNRNKRSVVLDLKRPAALEALMRLVERADVFMHSLRPQAAERLGISYGAIKERNPRIVYASAPGYRSDGPRRNRPAFDDVIQGESGIAAMIGRHDGQPRYVPMVVADKFCAHVLASAIAMALYSRERTGHGQKIEVPMFETMLAFNLVEHLWTDFLDTDGGHVGYARMFSPHRRPYATRDGHICLLAVSDDQWRRLFGVIGRPDLALDERFARLQERSRNINELYSLLSESLKTRTTAEWQQLLDACDLPNGVVNELGAMARDGYLTETHFFQSYEHPSEASMVTTAIPVQFSVTPGALRLPPPRLGEHTREVLAGELGYVDDDIALMTGLPQSPATS